MIQIIKNIKYKCIISNLAYITIIDKNNMYVFFSNINYYREFILKHFYTQSEYKPIHRKNIIDELID